LYIIERDDLISAAPVKVRFLEALRARWNRKLTHAALKPPGSA
jgi:hypothetical protein